MQDKALPPYRQSQQVGETSGTGEHPQSFPDVFLSHKYHLSTTAPFPLSHWQQKGPVYIPAIFKVSLCFLCSQHSLALQKISEQAQENAYFNIFKS